MLRSPWPQVGAGNALRLEVGILGRDPVPELSFEGLLACRALGPVVMTLQRLLQLGRQDNGVDLTCLLQEHRLTFGLCAEAAKTVLGFCDGNAHAGLLERLAILATLGPPQRRFARNGL